MRYNDLTNEEQARLLRELAQRLNNYADDIETPGRLRLERRLPSFEEKAFFQIFDLQINSNSGTFAIRFFDQYDHPFR